MIQLQNLTIDDRAVKYLPSPGLLSALEVAYMLKRPLLLTGEPGTGKTQFAYWVADQLSRSDGFLPQPLLYNTKTSSTAQDLFYHYDAVAHFREKGDIPTEAFIQLKALGLAIAGAIGKPDVPLPASILDRSQVSETPRGSVVLIDEIDKAPRDFPNDLLNEMENYEFEVREINRRVRLTDAAQKQKIIVILTSNFEKSLPDAFLRRCIYYHIEFPTRERLLEIIQRRLDISDDEYQNLEGRVQDFFFFREHPQVGKRPSTSEFIDWIRVLQNDKLLHKDFWQEDRLVLDEVVPRYLPILIKNKEDLSKFLANP